MTASAPEPGALPPSSGPEPSVADLLVSARAGDDRDRDELFRRCRPYLALLAQAQVESWLRAKVDPSDIVQQTLLEVHRDWRRFEGQTNAQWWAWLRRILLHNAADFVRRYGVAAKRQARREVRLGPRTDQTTSPGFEPAAAGDSPSREVERRDEQIELALALDRLPPDYREVIMLRNLERLPFDEVAERMGRSRPAAQMLWMRAVKKLESQMRQARESEARD